MSMRGPIAGAVLFLLASFAAGEELKAPAVTVQAVPRQPNGIETDDPATAKILVALVVVNASERELTNLDLIVAPGIGFAIGTSPRFPAKVAPFSTLVGTFELVPQGRAAYGKYDVMLMVQYRWRNDKTEFPSAQPVNVSLEIKRRFDEEAKGLPGGTAALFYLLLPVFPAFFAYQIVDRLRRGEGLQVPVFSTDYLLPAFSIGLLVNYLFSARVSQTRVLLAAAAIGALWPLLRWAWEAFQQWRWGFKETDDEPTYLRKALLSPWTRHDLWVVAKVGNEIWNGVQLAQPDGSPVLGPLLQVSPSDPADTVRIKSVVESTHGAASRGARKQLVREVKRKKATVMRINAVKRGANDHSAIIAAAELVGFELQSAEKIELLAFTP
jgi:uncharacterized membrane protein (GlpM family)